MVGSLARRQGTQMNGSAGCGRRRAEVNNCRGGGVGGGKGRRLPLEGTRARGGSGRALLTICSVIDGGGRCARGNDVGGEHYSSLLGSSPRGS